ncbi:hormogonium polysaccharide biosynthesis glycosyltransferase HpsE [Lusitaniella coriacea]|uniref:hormogonium polysaccharide biosynthesis glycosyltransferase HpsE n=1 Tax=Lusitaniella coriacea TaxID=1983105 RepID=UPI003CFA2BF0
MSHSEHQNLHAINLTVAIPTYNGATRLPFVIEQLRLQSNAEFINWEILIVDNNSSDETAEVIREYQSQWSQPFALRYICETQQGAAFARIRAIKEAKGEWVGFLDDDTVPAANWVAAACKFSEAHPQAGAYGSQVHGDYEVEPPPDFDRIASFFAITERGSQPHLYDPQMKMLPPSAGLVVRKEAWRASVPKNPVLSGRSNDSILNSEDLEAVLHIQNAGWEVWYNPDMEIYHQIPRDRLEKEYLLYLMRSTGLARHHIRMLRLKNWQKPLLFPFGLAKDTQKALFYFLKHRQKLKNNDVVASCEMEFLRSSILSPFYLWKRSSKS